MVLGHGISYYAYRYSLPVFAGIAEDLIYQVHVPLFFTISGFLCHRQPLRAYYKKKILRVLVPFWFFAFLKVFFSTVIVRHFAHADTIGGQLYDAFVIGRAYWFAYAIFLMLSIAPLFWEKDENTAPRMLFEELFSFAGGISDQPDRKVSSVFPLRHGAAVLLSKAEGISFPAPCRRTLPRRCALRGVRALLCAVAER